MNTIDELLAKYAGAHKENVQLHKENLAYAQRIKVLESEKKDLLRYQKQIHEMENKLKACELEKVEKARAIETSTKLQKELDIEKTKNGELNEMLMTEKSNCVEAKKALDGWKSDAARYWQALELVKRELESGIDEANIQYSAQKQVQVIGTTMRKCIKMIDEVKL